MRDRVTELLEEHKAELVRNHKHQIWRLPNGRTFVRSNTPSDRNSHHNDISDLRRLLGIKRKGGDGIRRERKLGGGRDRTIHYDKPVNTGLADQLRLRGIAEEKLREDIEMLIYQNDLLTSANEELIAEINTKETPALPDPCWFCRLKEWWNDHRPGGGKRALE